MAKTQLRRLVIEKFRALENAEIEFGDRITLVCGKNATSKSSILGIAAQIFSFEKDYVNDKKLSFEKLTGGTFKSQYSDHFRISDKFDTPGSMKVKIELREGYTEKDATAQLEIMKRGKLPRPVVRKNSTVPTNPNLSRNFTHPVIFLSLKRLFPIANRVYKLSNKAYLKDKDNKDFFLGLSNELLNRQSSLATGTEGTISSASAHDASYDQDSVSAGEDNAGQIVLALMSFRKLKNEYPEYKGGLLLIDEADAGLFPTAQVNLFRILDRECNELNLQVIMTSHSPTLIEHAFEHSQQYRRNYKTVYLSNTFGGVQVMHNWSWGRISADIHTKTVATASSDKLPSIRIYFEDREGADFFGSLMYRQPIRKFITPLPDLTLGCSNYLQLIEKKIPEFSEKSVVCLDGDVAPSMVKKDGRTVVLLPGNLPPDQLIFEFLFNLPPSHEAWSNELGFTREVFTKSAAGVIRELKIQGNTVDLRLCLDRYDKSRKPRELFKSFYNDEDFKRVVALPSWRFNPWQLWIKSNPMECNKFLEKFQAALYDIMKSGYSVGADKLTHLTVKWKRV